MDSDRVEGMKKKIIMNVFRLRIGALLHFLIAIGHLICLFFLEEAFRAYGISDEMRHLCFGQEWMLYVVTVCIAMAFAIAGLYALSASGDIRKLPFQGFVMTIIVGTYSIRVFIGLVWLLHEFTYLQFFSSLVPVLLIYSYFPGLQRR